MLAKPPVRKLARDLGVDLATVTGTGPGGSVTREDVLAAADAAAGRPAAAAPATAARGRREQRIPIRGVRKLTAASDGGQRVHRPARDRVPDSRHHRDDVRRSSG